MFSSDPFKEGLPKIKEKSVLERVKKSLQTQATQNNDSLHRKVFFSIESTSAMKIQKRRMITSVNL
jgi:hypothetical protein